MNCYHIAPAESFSHNFLQQKMLGHSLGFFKGTSPQPFLNLPGTWNSWLILIFMARVCEDSTLEITGVIIRVVF